MRIMNTNNHYNSKQQSFQALKINEMNIKQAGEHIFNGVRLALIPKEGKLFSNIYELAQQGDIYISAHPQNALAQEKDCLILDVIRGNNKVYYHNFGTKEYKTSEELAEALDKRITQMHKDAGGMGHCLSI